jgi:hypothetical protein
MWVPDRTRLLKIRLHNQGEDPETVWAEDLGIVVLHRDARYVRVGNIPVLHAKPTYGDVIEVLMHADDFPEWDRKGVDLDEIDTRILEDGGRWVAIINYWPSRPGSNLQSTYQALHVAAEARDIAVEGVLAEANRGCAYLAVPESTGLADLLAWLLSQRASFGFELLHPDADSP